MHTSFTVMVPIFLSSSKSSGCTHTPTHLACQRHVDGVRSSPAMDTLGGRRTRYLRNIALPSTSSTVQQTRRRNLAGRSASTPRLLTPDTRLPHHPCSYIYELAWATEACRAPIAAALGGKEETVVTYS